VKSVTHRVLGNTIIWSWSTQEEKQKWKIS